MKVAGAAKDRHLAGGFGQLPARPLLTALVEHVNTSYTVPFDVLTFDILKGID